MSKDNIPLWHSKSKGCDNLDQPQSLRWKQMTMELKDWVFANVAVDFSIKKKDDILERVAERFGETIAKAWGDKIISYVFD